MEFPIMEIGPVVRLDTLEQHDMFVDVEDCISSLHIKGEWEDNGFNCLMLGEHVYSRHLHPDYSVRQITLGIVQTDKLK